MEREEEEEWVGKEGRYREVEGKGEGEQKYDGGEGQETPREKGGVEAKVD